MKEKYDVLLVGAGLYNSVAAHFLRKEGLNCLVIEKRPHIAGNCYTENKNGIHAHKYGAHIFHTSNERVWAFVNNFMILNNFENNVLSLADGEYYQLPFNMNLFEKFFGVSGVEAVKAEIAKDVEWFGSTDTATNLEQRALQTIGKRLYEAFVKGYSEKQWGCPATEIPAWIIDRIPIRFTYDNNYYPYKYQGVATDGYTKMFEKLLKGVDVMTDIDYFHNRSKFDKMADKVIYSGAIDEFFEYRLGSLEYRSLMFEHFGVMANTFQRSAVVNFPSSGVKHTRIIDHKKFNPEKPDNPYSYITVEYPAEFKVEGDNERYYPINDEKNNALYQEYRELADSMGNVYFGGRLGKFKYFNMHEVIEDCFQDLEKIWGVKIEY
jgi:UDP-galactopyranose mutase